ncbi:hypothetical protein BBP40_012768 [Aspergillus hancockii]|nr:hypothetical protein BBP40_012768 [Aspergillus hancockii]
MIGIAIRYAVELGMHRRFKSSGSRIQDPYRIEVQRRVFWSAYVLDRAISLTLGRPFALSESEVDVDLPVDIDDDIVDAEIIHRSQQHVLHGARPSNLSSFVHLCRLRKLESRIKQRLYSAGSPAATTPDTSYDDIIDSFHNDLVDWLQNVPVHCSQAQLGPNYCLYSTQEFFRIQYSKALRMLLQHRITQLSTYREDSSKKYLALSARAAGDICHYYKTLHQRRPLGWNLLALHSIFTAGLTLLYCIWMDKDHPNLARIENVRSCSNVLFAISERWPTARRFRDIFEILAQRMIGLVSSHEPLLGDLDNMSFPPEDRKAVRPISGSSSSAPLPTDQDDFWAMLDELVDDEFIRSQFQLENETPSGFLDN